MIRLLIYINSLRDQLNAQEVPFTYSSQNVGYDFNDVPTLIHSWLNSDTHRSRMLNAKYNEMGGEVMQGYYTLIFVGEKKKGDLQLSFLVISFLLFTYKNECIIALHYFSAHFIILCIQHSRAMRIS